MTTISTLLTPKKDLGERLNDIALSWMTPEQRADLARRERAAVNPPRLSRRADYDQFFFDDCTSSDFNFDEGDKS